MSETFILQGFFFIYTHTKNSIHGEMLSEYVAFFKILLKLNMIWCY